MRTVYPIGHSTRAADVFIDLLRAHGIGTLVDVRTVPHSRHNPQFGRAALARATAAATAIMCAEAEPARCHRGLLSDALTVRGWRVVHILGDGAVEHAPSPLMRTVGDRPVYP